MRSFATSLLCVCVGLGLGGTLPASAGATEPKAAATDHDHDHDHDGETIEVVEVHEHHHPRPRDHEHVHWFGVQVGAVTTPLSPSGRVRAGDRVTSNAFKACLDPFRERHCSAIRGFDLRVQYYATHGAWDYPRWVGYFRTGYGAGRAELAPRGREGYAPGEPRSVSYASVPLFFGGNVYAFRRSPVRPYGGLGFGFDVLELRYRHERGPGPEIVEDVSARIGFELHAGLEARISNVVAITGEVMQLWSARRKIDGAPDFSNTGLTVMTGIAIGIPTPGSRRRHDHDHDHHHVIRREVRTTKAPAPPPAPPPAPTPPPPPAPVVVVPTPAPAPAPAPVVVVPTPAPAPPPAPAPAP